MKVKHILGIILVIVLGALIKTFLFNEFDSTTKVVKQQPKLLYTITGEESDLPLKEPSCAIADEDGNIYVSDVGNHRGVVFDKQGKFLFEFGGAKTEKPLLYPNGIGLLEGKIIIADSAAGTIYEFSSEGKYLKNWLVDSVKYQPAGIFVTPDHTVYVSDLLGKQILVFSEQGVLLRSINSDKISLGAPQGLAVDDQGAIWVVDGANYNVKQLKQNGELVSIFDGGPKQTLATPKGVALDNTGKIYVADTLANVIRVFDKAGKDLFSIGAPADQKDAFKLPVGLSINAEGNIIVADQGNNRIQVWSFE